MVGDDVTCQHVSFSLSHGHMGTPPGLMSLIIEKQQSQWGQLKAAFCPSKHLTRHMHERDQSARGDAGDRISLRDTVGADDFSILDPAPNGWRENLPACLK